MKEKKQNFAFGTITLVIVLLLTIGFSAFDRNMLLDDIALTVRPIEDIRVTGTWYTGSTNGAESSFVDYNVKSSLLSFDLPQENSTITYTVQVTNLGNVDMGILDILGLPDNLEYTLEGYNLKEKICNEDRCNSGIQIEFQITIKYKSGKYDSANTTYDLKLDYDFRRFQSIRYDYFDEEEIKDMPTEVLNGDTLVLQFDEDIASKLIITMNGEEIDDYKVENGAVTIENVTGDITITKRIELIKDFPYDENDLEQTYIIPITGYYKLEVWGAQGGFASSTDAGGGHNGGKGGYSVGAVYLKAGQKLYINVGGKGLTVSKKAELVKGGYNGGGSGFGSSAVDAGSGGGATHIAFSSGELSTLSEKIADILIVAGGGGGGSLAKNWEAGTGGGIGGTGIGGSQAHGGFSDTAGKSGSFGQGGNVTASYGSGAGGGYFGGGSIDRGGGGGSGYIGGVTNYGDVTAKTIAGNATFPTTDGKETETGHVGHGYAKITFLKAEIVEKKEEKFYYTGEEQTYVVPTTGYYKLEVWGAQGGFANSEDAGGNHEGGRGGYSVGAVYLKEGQTLYINVGGVGTTVVKTTKLINGGYNGGGSGFGTTTKYVGSGGGATHIAISSGVLSTFSEKIAEILIVAGGGGGGSLAKNWEAGVGGGITGGGMGGTQGRGGIGDTAGKTGTFGQGGNVTASSGSGGGGGYFGGGSIDRGGGGGSGYIGGVTDYDDVTAQTISGGSSFPNINDTGTETGHAGYGFAKITFIKSDKEKKENEKFYYTGGEQTYVVPTTGYYKLEVWGAQGGFASAEDAGGNHEGGKGGYSVGAVYLEKGQTLYINVGGVGTTVVKTARLINGGYNGGGSGFGIAGKYVGSGGGATHIAISSGVLSTFSEKIEDILIVAGGGGGGSLAKNWDAGTGGGITGTGIGGTQSHGGFSNTMGKSGSFGQGGNVTASYGSGAGGGYFGGGSIDRGGGGGSGYIGGVTDYGDVTAKTIAGSATFPTTDGKTTEIGHVGHGYAKITFLKEETVEKNEEKFYYAGGEQTYVVPTTGYYKLEVWGASGGNAQPEGLGQFYGGKGGYSVGAVYLEKGQKLYINVGGVGLTIVNAARLINGGYNGGGSAFGGSTIFAGSGGGATHIATTSGELSTLSEKVANILIVAGGGGGGSLAPNWNAGVGGGIIGTGMGGTQGYGGSGDTLGKTGTFGQGGNVTSSPGSGGGGGYYGGGSIDRGGGGGSGYIGGVTDYGDVTAQTIAGNTAFPTTDGKTTETGHEGHGYAKITFIKNDEEKKENKKFYYIGEEQTYVVPTTGYYKLEVWGAQGGTANGQLGGRGGYSVGAAYLKAGQTLYINVGGPGSFVYKKAELVEGGYNGGGSAFGSGSVIEGSGGGATHIATVSGELSTLSEKIGNILLVAGGGAGAEYVSSSDYHTGGVGGGTYGGGAGGTRGYGGNGPTSTKVGTFGQGGSSITSYGAGAGGGYYGGGSVLSASSGGGSGYIGGVTDYEDIIAQTLAGNTTFPTANVSGEETGHAGYGYARITFIKSDEEKKENEKFYYTGGEQKYVVPTTGYYKLEVWGAQGGSANGQIGGKGGYSVGAVYLKAGQTLYINVGGPGSFVYKKAELAPGGYNGGGSAFGSASVIEGSGGGATHIATVSGKLSSLSEKIGNILIVAGGGAGGEYISSSNYHTGGAGGGTYGGGYSGTQGYGGNGSTPEKTGIFGQGGNAITSYGAGAGGGYYGGGSLLSNTSGGGSGYIGGVTDYDSVTAQTIAGSKEFSTTDGKGTETGHAGYGYAKITFIKSDEEKKENEKFYYNGGEQKCVVPTTGYYKLEVWGAQGGSANGYLGGRGGYSVGAVYLEKDQILYINVGGVGSFVYQKEELVPGGYNGGGSAFGATNKYVGSGGGATHIATISGKLSSLSEKTGNILIVAGGGAGAEYVSSNDHNAGGVGGGTSGGGNGGSQAAGGTGSTEEKNGAFGQGGNAITSYGAGAGGGYYGGGSILSRSSGGGSGYIGGVTNYGKVTAQTIAGSKEFSTTDGKETETGHAGYGFAKITFIE